MWKQEVSRKETSLHLGDCPDFARTPHPSGGSPVSLQLAAGIFKSKLQAMLPRTFSKDLNASMIQKAVSVKNNLTNPSF